MKKSMTFRPTHLLVLLAGFASFATAAPYGPNGRESSWTQPSGEVVPLKIFGDEYYARTESTAGYTLIFKGNTYYYAQLSADGKALESTGVTADQAAPGGLEKHLDLPNEQIIKKSAANHAKYDTERNKRWNKRVQAVRKINAAAKGAQLRGAEAADAKIQAAPVEGNIVGLTLLVQFPNDPATTGADPVNFPTTRAKVTRFCNEVGYNDDGNTGSVRDFFSDQSEGKLTYTQTVTTIVTLPNPRNYYNYSDYPANKTLYFDIDVSASNIIADAVEVLKNEGFDFSSLTVGTDGNAVATNVFFAGPDSGVFAQGLWPHQYHVDRDIKVGTGNSITLYNYQITNIPDSKPVIGTFCHENGHLILNYPDIYSLDGEGVGEHCLMGSGNYLNDGKTPSPINGYFKELVGWGNVTDIAPGDFLTTKLPTTGNVGYRITNPNLASEFFFVENRGKGDKWAQYSDDKGIAIWHVDETIEGNLRGGAHYGIALMQADGKRDLENGRNRGDSGDLFDLIDPKFSDRTDPSARWWSGKKSFVDVEVLSDLGANTTVAFGGILPNTIVVKSPNGGEVLFKDSKYPITWKSNISGNVNIALFKDGTFLQSLAKNQQDDGLFYWKVPAKLAASNRYTIRISSVSNPVPASDLSDSSFAVTDSTFPPDNVVPVGWFKPAFANTMWEATGAKAFEGTHSLGSGKTADGKISAIGYRSEFKAGSISFYIKTSTEKGFDFAKFYIDDVAQPFNGPGSGKALSGDNSWQFVQVQVPAGNHKFVWTYEKDTSYGDILDTVWIDGVTLPPGTQDIVVQEPKGKDLVDAVSTRAFPDVALPDTSKPLVFTIKNRGGGLLLGLSIDKSGKNSADFTVRNLKKTDLDPGESTTFEVTFTPKAYGLRTAEIKINSNDSDQSEFSVNLQGTGIGYPKIELYQPVETPMTDGDSRNFGIATVDTKGKFKTFTITNAGSTVLNQLKVTKTGTEAPDFVIGKLGVTSLAPGESTTFTVTFSPSDLNVRKAVLHVQSNDSRSGPFEINVTGKGSPPIVALSRAATAGSIVEAALGKTASSSVSIPTTAIEVVDGRKYLALTVTKLPGGISPGIVEVSPNLLDWYSGDKHTTILVDDATTLKVRDNAPVTQDAKRYIRLK